VVFLSSFRQVLAYQIKVDHDNFLALITLSFDIYYTNMSKAQSVSTLGSYLLKLDMNNSDFVNGNAHHIHLICRTKFLSVPEVEPINGYRRSEQINCWSFKDSASNKALI
jgi:hypothetical protein